MTPVHRDGMWQSLGRGFVPTARRPLSVISSGEYVFTSNGTLCSVRRCNTKMPKYCYGCKQNRFTNSVLRTAVAEKGV